MPIIYQLAVTMAGPVYSMCYRYCTICKVHTQVRINNKLHKSCGWYTSHANLENCLVSYILTKMLNGERN